MSFLLKLVEQYIAYSQYTSNPLLEDINLLQSYMKRGLDKHYQYAYAQTKTRLENYPHRNLDFFYLQHLLSEIDNQNFLRKKIRKHDERLQSAADYFDLYVIARKLEYFCEMQDRKMTLQADYKLNMLPEIQLTCSKKISLSTPALPLTGLFCKHRRNQMKPNISLN